MMIYDVISRYVVELYEGDQSVSATLVAESLAQYPGSVLPNIDLNLLLGQQIRMVLGDINSLSDFTVNLLGYGLPCTAHNLSTATETYEQTLRDAVGKDVIVYVGNVLETK